MCKRVLCGFQGHVFLLFQIDDSEEDLRVVTPGFGEYTEKKESKGECNRKVSWRFPEYCFVSREIFWLSFIFFRLVLRFPPHKGRFDLLFPLRERDEGRWGRRSLSRLLKSKMAAVLHRNSMDRDNEYHSQLRLIKRIIKNNTIYYIKVSGIPSGNKSIKTTYPHMWRYDILT